MFGLVRRSHRFDRSRGGSVQTRTHERNRIAAHIVVAPEARGRVEKHNQRIGVGDPEPARLRLKAAALMEDPGLESEAQRCGNAVRGAVGSGERESVGRNEAGVAGLLACQPDRRRERTADACRDTQHEDPVDRRDKRFTPKADAADRIGNGRQRPVEIEFAAVVFCALMVEIQPQVSRRLIGHLLERTGHQEAIGKCISFAVAAVEDELPHLGKMRQGLGIDRLVGAAGPQRIFVDLQPLAGDAAEKHGAEAAVAERQRFCPRGRRLPVPEEVIRRAHATKRRRAPAGVNNSARPAGAPMRMSAPGFRCSASRASTINGSPDVAVP